MIYTSLGLGLDMVLNTETANFNPTFTIDKKANGVINFDSTMANQAVYSSIYI